MDMSVLHRHPLPDRDYFWKDKLNSLTGHLDCRFLEWTGWYNQDIYQRLLGHYRLYQLFKKESKAADSLPQPLVYIVNYRVSHGFKFLLSRITGILYYIGSFGKPYYPLQTEGINKLLVNEYAHILQAFLTEADKNFEEALSNAIRQIISPEFGKKSANALFHVKQSAVILQTRNEFNSYHNNTHYFNDYTTVNTANGIKGKEKGVFSKKQILILFDLLAEIGKMEKIDFSKPNKFDSIAELLCAITGKSKDSWIEQLKDGRNKGLYEFKNEGERKQLIVTLTNLSETFRKAGFRSIATLTDKKLIKLEVK
ncbi:hypothetical protein [Terrimonas alba]|uniref:hypothetical protein n=1 Tax=Terrimonas alba TaxID=3349636 RepID=UPI0035F4D302